MNYRRFFSVAVSIAMLFTIASVAIAQTYTPNVQVSERGIVDGTVLMNRATVAGPAWVVIHADAEGKPGPVIGYAPVVEGENLDVVVEIDEDAATPLLHAMLHVDSGVVGVYEFPGADVPIKIGEDIVMAKFSAAPPLLPVSGGGTSPLLILSVAGMILFAVGGSVLVSRRRPA